MLFGSIVVVRDCGYFGCGGESAAAVAGDGGFLSGRGEGEGFEDGGVEFHTYELFSIS